MTEIETNKRAAHDFLAKIGQAPPEEVLALLAEDLEYWVPGRTVMSGTHGKDSLRTMLEALSSMFDGPLVIEPYSIVAEGNKVAVEATGGGRLRNGQEYANQYHFLFEFAANGKINRLREYIDTEAVTAAFAPA